MSDLEALSSAEIFFSQRAERDIVDVYGETVEPATDDQVAEL